MKNRYTENDFTFVVCAYKESPYLEECIRSLLNQSIKCQIIVSTSTPNEYIKQIVRKYSLELYINQGPTGIAEDWNFGINQVTTTIATLAHQDDVYCREFAEYTLEKLNSAKKPLISFCDYGEIRDGNEVNRNMLLVIKRIMLSPLKLRIFQNSVFMRRRILSLGSPICCPSVTFVRNNLPKKIFTSQYRSDVDWQAWEKISKLEGTFVYSNKILMFHRIHEDSATTEIIADNDRTREDFEMFCMFWPKWIAKIIEKQYKKSENSNQVK